MPQPRRYDNREHAAITADLDDRDDAAAWLGSDDSRTCEAKLRADAHAHLGAVDLGPKFADDDTEPQR
jgi:hypothetical protein